MESNKEFSAALVAINSAIEKIEKQLRAEYDAKLTQLAEDMANMRRAYDAKIAALDLRLVNYQPNYGAMLENGFNVASQKIGFPYHM